MLDGHPDPSDLDADRRRRADHLHRRHLRRLPFEILEAIRIHVPHDAATVLVVGHEPGMPATALTLDPDGDIDRFPTSAYAIVDVSVPWAGIGLEPGGGTLRALRIPRE